MSDYSIRLPWTDARTTGRDLLAIAVAGAAARVVLMASIGGWGDLRLWEYDDIARNILAGRGFVYDYRGTEYRAFTTPGWPFVLSLLLRVGDYHLVQGFQIAACLLLGATAYLMVRPLWGRLAAFVAGSLCVLHPGLAYYSVFNSDPLPLNAAIVLLIAATVVRLGRAPSAGLAIITGILIGVSVLTRGTTLFLVPLAAVWLWATIGWRRTMGVMTIVVLVASSCVVPWLLRNQAVLDAPVMTSTNGEMLWWGNNPHASGGTEAVDGKHIREYVPAAVRRTVEGSRDELVHDRAFRSEAVSFVRANPAAFAGLSAGKFFQFWWFGPFWGKEYPTWFLPAYKAIYALELVLGIAGVVVAVRSSNRAAAWLLLAIPLAISAFQSLFYVQGRHRWMVESFLLVFVAVALVAGLKRAGLVE